MSRRGVSPIIAWVLLIGMAISLAMVVFNWASQQTRQLTDDSVTYVEAGLKCDQVSLNAVGKPDPERCQSLTVTNTGFLAVHKLLIRPFNADKTSAGAYLEYEPSQGIQPSSPPVSVNRGCSSCAFLEVVPLLKSDEKFAACFEKKVVVNCT